MARRKKNSVAPSPLGPEPSGVLKHQSRYGVKPWQPGEIPGRNGSLLVMSQPHDIPATPYGEFLGVEKPANRGRGYPLKMDVEGKETLSTAKRGKL
jgi:hypothetical protein